MKDGILISGSFNALPTSAYMSLNALSVHNQVYELRAETGDLTQEQQLEALGKLMHLNIEGMKVLGVETGRNLTRMQVVANQFLWAPFIAALPTIIPAIAVLIVGIILAAKLPDWALAIPFIGVGVAIVFYAIYKAKAPPKSK